jgi:hypothetical protein
MTTNHPYDSLSLMRYQMSFLSLAVALDRQAPSGPTEGPEGALLEVGQLRN